MRRIFKHVLAVAFVGLMAASNTVVAVTYKDDIAYTALSNYLSSQQKAVPDGSGVAVMLVEASQIQVNPNNSNEVTFRAWAPNEVDAEFAGKTFNNISPGYPAIPVAATSDHATGVGRIFFGNSTSMATGVNNIEVHQADHWLIDGFLNSFVVNNNVLELSTSPPNISAARVANHSYVGGGDGLTPVLARTDWLAAKDELINVVAMNNRDPATPNSSAQRPLLASAYNTIAVGRTDGNHSMGTVVTGLNSPYNTARARPDVVAPMGTTSAATPVVSAAAALLVEVGHEGGNALSSGFTTNRAGNADGNITEAERIYNAERAETIKAALMAGADRITHNTSTTANIADYRSASHQTTNGLDDRFGAGQINIFTSYQIIAGGEHDATASAVNIGCAAGTVLCGGFDHVDGFGGAGSSPTENRYTFSTGAENWLLSAALVWNVQVADDFSSIPSVTLNNLDLQLTDANGSVLFSSASTVDNSENMWLTLAANSTYSLNVLAHGTTPYSQSYALAWHLSAVPLPATVWLLAPALGLLSLRRRRFPRL